MRQITSAVLLLGAGVGVAHGQIQHNDFTSMNGTFSTNSATPVMISPGQMGISAASGKNLFIGSLPNLNQALNSSKSSLGGQSFSKFNSPMNAQKGTAPQWKTNFPIGQNLPLKMAPSAEMKKPQMLSNMENKSALNDYTNRDNYEAHQMGPPKFTDGFTFHAVDNGTQLEQAGRDLSLQDVNRYQFQGSFSNTPGLPVVHAGGQGSQVTLSGSSLSSISNSSTLFDSNSMPTSQVRSGASVAPRVLTSEGTMAYMPHNPLGSSRLGVSDGSSRGMQTVAQETVPSSNSGSTGGGLFPLGSTFTRPGSYSVPDKSNGKDIPVDMDDAEIIVRGDKNAVSLSKAQ
ncbi:MAG TPA: hypothetical protein VK737_06065 [Opitutales bacterium]|nr:hypothetical protein [Opitutales bacterium]